MPNGSNVVIKKNDGTTDQTLTFISPQNGAEPAVFRNQAIGTALSHQPEYRARVAKLPGSLSKVTGSCKHPETALNSTTNVRSVVGKGFTGGFNCTIDDNMTQSEVNEAVAAFVNWMAASLMKQTMQTRTSLT